MNPEAWFVLAVVLGVLAAMISNRVSPAVAMSGGMVAVLVAGIVSPEQALAGFSNPAPLTVAALFILARAVEKTGALTPVVRAALGASKGLRISFARLVLPTVAASSFLNNTPIVAMLMPEVPILGQGQEALGFSLSDAPLVRGPSRRCRHPDRNFDQPRHLRSVGRQWSRRFGLLRNHRRRSADSPSRLGVVGRLDSVVATRSNPDRSPDGWFHSRLRPGHDRGRWRSPARQNGRVGRTPSS